MLKINRFVLLTSLFVVLFENINSVIYSVDNSKDIFSLFKEKYKKVYENVEEEQYRYEIFIDNLNEVEKLNNETTDKNTFFILNQHGDLNPTEIEKHYALNIKPCK